MPTVRIEVTANDVAASEPCHGRKCAVALAIRRVLGDYVCVDRFRVWLSDDALTQDRPPVPLPAEVSRRIKLSDQGQIMEPFAFDLEVPE